MRLSYKTPLFLNNNQTISTGQMKFKFTEKTLQFSFSENNELKYKWLEILACADNPDLEIIFFKNAELKSNVLEDHINLTPPFSLQGKLLAFLFQRYKFFKGASDKGLIILSFGLTARKTETLEAIILELAHLNELEPAFLDWIENNNYFCNKKMFSDRILFRKQ